MNRYTVQAVYIMESGLQHSMRPVDLDGEQALEEFERKTKYSLVQEEYLIEGRNHRDHFICIRPQKVATVIVDIKRRVQIPDFQEPDYNELKAKWETALAEDEQDEQQDVLQPYDGAHGYPEGEEPPEEHVCDAPPPYCSKDGHIDVPPTPKGSPAGIRVGMDPGGPAVVSVVPASVAEPVDPQQTKSIKVAWNAKPPVPEQRVNWPQSEGSKEPEETQEMVVLKADEVKAMENPGLTGEAETELLARVRDGLREDTESSGKPQQGPPAPRRRAASGPRGKRPNRRS